MATRQAIFSVARVSVKRDCSLSTSCLHAFHLVGSNLFQAFRHKAALVTKWTVGLYQSGGRWFSRPTLFPSLQITRCFPVFCVQGSFLSPCTYISVQASLRTTTFNAKDASFTFGNGWIRAVRPRIKRNKYDFSYMPNPLKTFLISGQDGRKKTYTFKPNVFSFFLSRPVWLFLYQSLSLRGWRCYEY